MIDPSGIVRPEGEKLELSEVRDGLFIVKNAYEGIYEYFAGRPIENDYADGKTVGESDGGKGCDCASDDGERCENYKS